MIALLGALTLVAAVGVPPTAALTVALDRTSITVGDPVTGTPRLRLPEGMPSSESIALTGVGETWGEAAVLVSPRLEPQAGPVGAERVWTFSITAFAPGNLKLPPLEARAGGDPPRLFRSALPPALEVRSVLAAKDDNGQPAPPAPPRALPVPVAVWVGAAALALALAATVLALVRRRAPLATATAVPLPPLAELEAALAALGGPEMLAAHRGLSSSLRRYFGRRLGFPALESTTTEIARRLAASGLDPGLPRRARRLLAACDGVKFARQSATAEEFSARRDEATTLAHELEVALAPPPTGEP